MHLRNTGRWQASISFSVTRTVEDDDSSFFADVFALVLWKFAISFYISLCFRFDIDKSWPKEDGQCIGMGGKPDTHWLPQGLASGKGKAGPKRMWLTVGYVLVEPKKLKSHTKIQKTCFRLKWFFRMEKAKRRASANHDKPSSRKRRWTRTAKKIYRRVQRCMIRSW